MPIYDQTFRHYEGERRTHALWWVVAKNTLRPFFKGKFLARMLTSLGFIGPVIIISLAFFLSAKVDSFTAAQGRGADEILKATDLPFFGKNLNITTVLFLFIVFCSKVLWLLIALYGSASVSNDRKHFALPLYFSRPLSIPDYMIGKVLGLSIYPIGLMSASVIVIFVQAWAYFFTWADVVPLLPTLLGCFVYILIVGGVTALSMAAFSSMTKTPSIAVVTYMGFWFATNALSHGLDEALRRQDTVPFDLAGIMSLGRCLNVIGVWLLQPEAEWLKNNPDFANFGVVPAFVATAVYCLGFVWLLRRNLKVVEVVK